MRFASRIFLLIIFCCVIGRSVDAQEAAIRGTLVDKSGGLISGVVITLSNLEQGLNRETTTDAAGRFAILSVQPGRYSLTAQKEGFAVAELKDVLLHVGDEPDLKISLEIGAVTQKITVAIDLIPLIQTETSSSGATITPQQIEEMPINGRNYLDLLQLVPGVTINRQSTGDASTPILGERAGNTVFLIDGLPNRNEVDGGPAAEFNQDSILEFQVVTGGYKAEFGHGSGGVVNVVSKSGTNDWHGGASVFHRNYKLDSPDVPSQSDAPFLLRWDPSAQIGGPVVKDRIFFFGSAERIVETRSLNFQFPPATPDILKQIEEPLNHNSHTYETRVRGKLDEQLGRHHLSEQLNLTNNHVTDFLPLSQATSLPSTRNNINSRFLMVGLTDTVSLGDLSNPVILNVYGQYRREPFRQYPSHVEGGTALINQNLFSAPDLPRINGDQGIVRHGPSYDNLLIDQEYISAGASLAKQLNRHGLKLGWDFQRMHVDGAEPNNAFIQVYGLISDIAIYGPQDSGIQLVSGVTGAPPNGNAIRLRNNYNGLFVQDDWKIMPRLTANLGLRWDYDNKFPNKTNFSPRLGFAWSVSPNTVVRGSWGLFYDHFRLGLARDIPGFGGANVLSVFSMSFPRLFYGNPGELTQFFVSVGAGNPCVAHSQTDAEVAATGAQCTRRGVVQPGVPLFGIDHLNSVVAPGHAPIPAGAIVDVNNVQDLSGLTPQEFADAASIAIGKPAGSLGYDQFGHLTDMTDFGQPASVPITIDPHFRTPYTNAFTLSVQRQIRSDMAVEVSYLHKSINNILGLRDTNLAFEARMPDNSGALIPGTGDAFIVGYGPWFHGTYDGMTFEFRKRMTKRFSLDTKLPGHMLSITH